MLCSKTPIVLWSLCAVSLARSLPSTITTPFVYLEDSDVSFIGTSANGTESFQNIRFGQDTSGSNRFAPPKPYIYPAGSVVNASQSGAACPQQKDPLGSSFPIFSNVTDISEDCLNLRIDRPANTSASARLPVLVYIYGGGDTIGQIYDANYNPSPLVASANQKGLPVIYVAMNYRLGIFGFASSPALNETDSLNAGLLDQRLALWWIQDNIAAFGGDPDQVTIFGESDGATGVGLQITAYGGDVYKTPFRRAIMESGGPTADTGTSINVSGDHTAQVIEKVNCTSNSSFDELQCLRKLPMATLLDAAIVIELTYDSFGGLDVFIPTSPSTFIPDSPSTLLKTGQFARNIDIISGWNENDGSLFTPTDLNTTSDVATWLAEAYPGLTNASIAQALALYPESDFNNNNTSIPPPSPQYYRASQMQRDVAFTCPSVLMVQSNAQYAFNDNVSNYLFALNQSLFTEFFELEGVAYYGVSHMSDIAFVFNNIPDTVFAEVADASDYELAAKVSASWASFATTGNPSHGNDNISITGWQQALSATNRNDSCSASSSLSLQVIGGPDARSAHTGSALGDYNENIVKRCAFWNSAELLAQVGV